MTVNKDYRLFCRADFSCHLSVEQNVRCEHSAL